MPRRKSSTAATPKQHKRQLSSSDSRNPSKDHTPAAISSPGTQEEGKKNKKDKKRKQGSLNDQQQHLWREGVKTGLGPGKQVFIEKPKPRGDGGIKTAWKDWESTVEALSEKISEVDETVPELPPKDLVCPSFSLSYYVQIGPNGQSFVGSGLWMPEAQGLSLLRRDIDQNPGRLRGILVDPGIRRHIFDGVAKDEKKAIKAFASHNEESALKTRPKASIKVMLTVHQGYAADNPNIELLRLRSFTMGKRLSEQEVLAPNALSRITELIAVMVPFVSLKPFVFW
ncbi:hypothetical protein DV738_g2144, partial [Chaetothyriales sp. CBS 135597]